MFQVVNCWLSSSVGGTPYFVADGGAVGSANVFAPNTIAPAYPAGIQSNDIFLMHIHLEDGLGNASIFSVTGGWTLADEVPLSGDMTAAVYWKRATGSESGTETVTFSEDVDAVPARACISAWRDCVTSGTPFEGATHDFKTASSSNTFGSGVSTTGPNRRVVTFFGLSEADQSGTATNGWSEHYDTGTASGNDAHESCYSIEAANAGHVQPCLLTLAGAATRMVTFSLALLPRGGSAGTSPAMSYPYSYTLTNADAELGNTQGWRSRSGGVPGALTAPGGGSPHAGTYSFVATSSGATAVWDQGVPVLGGMIADVDAGLLYIQGSAYHIGYSGDADSGRLYLEFYDSSGSFISSQVNSGTDPSSWTLETVKAAIPVGTRRIRLGTNNTRASGTELSTYWDDFALAVNTSPY